MDEKIKNKVREIQHKYCGESVETKLYWAIKETEERLNCSENKPKTNGKVVKHQDIKKEVENGKY